MITVLSLALAAAPVQPTVPMDRTISVPGDADIKVAPDQVLLTLSVVTVEKSVSKSKAVNDERVAKTLAVLKKAGIAEKDLQTDQISIEPVYDNGSSYGKAKDPDGYQTSKSITVLLREVSKFEGLLAAVLEAGTNRVQGITFQTSELRKHRDAARSLALKAAKEKAEAMAKEYGMKVGKARLIAESSSGWSGPMALRGNVMQNAMQSAGGAFEGSESFAAGQIAIHASVTVTFDLE